MLSDRGKITPPSKKKQAQQSYAALPAPARASQMQSTGVLRPDYEKAAQALHSQRHAQSAKQAAAAAKVIARKTERTVGKGNTAVKHPKHGGSLLGAVSPAAAVSLVSHIAEAGPAAAVPLAAAGHFGINLPDPAKMMKNAPKDAADLAVTTPSSFYHLGDQAVHGKFKDIGHELVQPYKDLAKDPKGFVESHPVTTYLMVKPVAHVPDRIAGMALRVAGKQTLKGEAATLPGTALKIERPRARGAVKNALQARSDAKHGTPTLSAEPGRQIKGITVKSSEVQKRVDSFYDATRHREMRARNQAIKEAHDQKMPAAQAETHLEQARKTAQADTERRFAEEFGANQRPDVSAASRDAARAQRHAAEADLGAARAKLSVARDAHKAAVEDARVAKATQGTPIKDSVGLRRVSAEKKAANVAARRARVAAEQAKRDHMDAKSAFKQSPLTDAAAKGRLFVNSADAGLVRRNLGEDFTVRKVGDQYSVLPKVATERLMKQRAVGSSKAGGAIVMRTGAKAFGKAVLAFSNKFLPGQALDPAVRNLLTGGGTGALGTIRFNRTVAALKRVDPAAAQDLRDRTAGEKSSVGKSGLAQEYAGIEGLHVRGKHDPRRIYDAYTDLVFRHVNGTIEIAARKAMAGKALKQSPLMETKLLGLSKKATEDAARGLTHPETQDALAQELHRVYGRYSGFSPGMRETIMHTTPFIPWYLNMARFVLKTIPHDHPLAGALVANVDAATEEWRKQHELSYHGTHKPGFLMGQAPSGMPVGRFTSFAPADAAAAAGGLFLPQIAPALVGNLALGVDWKGQALKGGRIQNALLTEAESLIPGVAQADRVTGLGAHYVQRTGTPSVLQGKNVKADAVRLVNPLAKPRHKSTGSSGGGGGAAPAGVSKSELQQAINAAQSAGPSVSKSEIEAALKAAHR